MSAPAPDLVLASTSVYRRVLLERLGVPFRCRAPLCDEARLKLGESNPTKLAERLAYAKASSLVATEPGAAIIGCDQVVSFAGQAVGKPYTAAGAIDQLTELAGHAHDLITALAVIQGDRILRHTDVSRLRMRPLTARRHRALRQGRRALRLCRQLQDRGTGNRPVRANRVERPYRDHGLTAGRAGVDPARAGPRDSVISGRLAGQGPLTRRTPRVAIRVVCARSSIG